MTYDEVVAELRIRQEMGERDVELSPERYAAYCGGLQENTRLMTTAHVGEYDWVWFRNVKVRKGRDLGVVTLPCTMTDFEFPPCE